MAPPQSGRVGRNLQGYLAGLMQGPTNNTLQTPETDCVLPSRAKCLSRFPLSDIVDSALLGISIRRATHAGTIFTCLAWGRQSMFLRMYSVKSQRWANLVMPG